MAQVTVAELAEAVGEGLGSTGWITVTQAMIDAFAAVTGDDQWIHVDVERAADSPYGTTIAHGHLTLSLVPRFVREVIEVTDLRLAVNYGLDRCRFPAPVPAGARVRGVVEVGAATWTNDRSLQVGFDVRVEVDGADKPGCVARTLSRYYADPAGSADEHQPR